MKNLKLIQVIKTGLSLASINLILAFIGLEVVSLGFYYYQEKQLFYTRKNTISQVREELKKTGTRLGKNINNELSSHLSNHLLSLERVIHKLNF